MDQARTPQNAPQSAPQQAAVLVPFTFWWEGPPALPGLRAAIAAHLADLGWPAAEPLRWAITAVDPSRGLQLEGVAVSGSLPAGPPARC
ncbi:MAG: hypothetical protein ACKOBY_11630 [Cyanobium sp.]